MGGMRKVIVLGALLAPMVVTDVLAQGVPGTAKSPAGWPAVAEQANTDALTFTREMLARIHHMNQMEVAVGRIAQERGSSPEVRRYGRLLVADHARADKQLAEYAKRQRGIAIGEPQVMMDVEREQMGDKMAAIEELKTLSGPMFDSQLLTMMVGEHKNAIQAVDNARGMVEDPELRTILRKVVPILRQHLWIAQSLGGIAEPTS